MTEPRTFGPGPDVRSVGFGVIGANSFVANAAVLPAIVHAPHARLVATASRSGDVPRDWASTDVGSYEAVIAHPEVDAIYIPLPNGMHQEWTEKAAAAGKHVLCEKPLASDSATAQAMADTCADAGVLLAEAWMTPFSMRYEAAFDMLHELGKVDRIDSRFTFTIGPEASDNYRWDPRQGGGALLDVGIYCLGPIIELFGQPTGIRAEQSTTDRGVDASTRAELVWPDGRSASIHCSFVDPECQCLRFASAAGQLELDGEPFTGSSESSLCVELHGDVGEGRLLPANDPYQTMVEVFAAAIAGLTEWPRPIERSIEMLQLIERIRDAAAS